jgi:hypothetical protein
MRDFRRVAKPLNFRVVIDENEGAVKGHFFRAAGGPAFEVEFSDGGWLTL